MKIISNAQLSKYSYYAIGGEASELAFPASTEDMSTLLKSCLRNNRSYFLLGSGTNSLISDQKFDGVVIKFDSMNRVEQIGNSILCGAGVGNTSLVEFALQRELAGVAWMNFLPGQLGATVRMNARCYGGEISSVVSEVESVNETGDIKRRASSKDVFRGYKDTIFMTNREVITSVKLDLKPGKTLDITRKMSECETDRKSKGQFDYPSCGCVFKNDYQVGVPSGMLIEAVGLKGFKLKGAMVSPDHANFIFNINANAREILELSFLMRERVFEEFGVWLEYEMEVLGDLPKDLLQEKNRVETNSAAEKKLDGLRAAFNQRRAQTSK